MVTWPSEASADEQPVEDESYRILRSRIDLSRLPKYSRDVTERVIYASADFDYATDLVCDEDALRAGRRALTSGAALVVDVRMLAAGITSRETVVALELAPLGIRVNCVAPGAVEGERTDRVFAGQAEVRGIPVEAVRRAMIERLPLGRMVTADDIVDAALFLASDLARNISGQVLAVNAGDPAG